MSLNGAEGMKEIGGLDRRITIQNFTTTSDFGTETKTYATWKTVWAAKMHMGVRELDKANKETAFTATHYYIRYLDGIRKDYRVIDEYSNVYDIVGVEEIGRRRYLRLTLELRQ